MELKDLKKETELADIVAEMYWKTQDRELLEGVAKKCFDKQIELINT